MDSGWADMHIIDYAKVLTFYIIHVLAYEHASQITHGRWPNVGISGWPNYNVIFAGGGNVGSLVACYLYLINILVFHKQF